MRFLPNARIVVLDGDARRRGLICAELAELGLTQVLPAGSVKEARQLAAARPLDLCIVDPRALDHDSRSKVFPNPFQAGDTPAILLAADTSAATLEASAAAGYRAVIGLPVAPRLLYRRIGSILQKARRTARSTG
jgi:two-component system, OmpR family, response regulator